MNAFENAFSTAENVAANLASVGVPNPIDVWDWELQEVKLFSFGRKWLLLREAARYRVDTERGQRQAGLTDMTIRRRGTSGSLEDQSAVPCSKDDLALIRGEFFGLRKARALASGLSTPSTDCDSRSRSPELC